MVSAQDVQVYPKPGLVAPVYSVAFSPDGKYILSGHRGNIVKRWDIATGSVTGTFADRTGNVNSVAVSPDGRFSLSVSQDGTIRLGDISTGQEIARLIAFNDGEWIVITPDGYYNASPRGDEYLSVRIDDEVYGMDQFSEIFYQPEVVEARLQGGKDGV